MSNNPHNQNSAIYDLIYETRFGPMYQNFTNKSLVVISTILQTGKILDIGCGTGRLTIPLASNKYNVVGVDLNELMLKELKSKSSRLNLTIQTTIDQYGLENQNCDLALAVFTVLSYTLEEEDLIKLFQDINRHLKPGGSFLFDLGITEAFNHHEEFNRNGLKGTINVRYTSPGSSIANYSENIIVNRSEFPPNYNVIESFQIRCWTLGEISNLLTQCGFNHITQVRGLEGTGANYFVCTKEKTNKW